MWTIGPMPFYLAQLTTTLVWNAVNCMCILGCSISLFKMLLVTHFDLIFNQNPEFLGKIVLSLSIIAGVIPNIVLFIYQTINGAKVAPVVAYLYGEQTSNADVSAMQKYGTFWLVSSVAMLVTATVLIPKYVKRHQQPAILVAESHEEAMKSISLARVLLGTSCLTLVVITNIIFQLTGHNGDFPFQALLAAILICLQLIFFILDDNIKSCIRKTFNKKFQDLQLSCCLTCLLGRCNPKISPANTTS